MINAVYTVTDRVSRIQKTLLILPCAIPAITARIISAPNTVMIVPAIVVVTEVSLATPYRLTIGYATKVWDAYILANKIEVVQLKCRV